MSVAYGEIARVLEGARKRQERVVLLAAAGFGLAAALLCVFVGAAALAMGARIGARPVALAGGITAVVAAIAAAVRSLLRTAWSDEAAARTVARGEPALSSDLVSSVELFRERGDIQATGRFSLALVDGHVERTAARARRVDVARAISDRWARRGGLALLGVALVHGVAFLLGGAPFAHAYGRVISGDPGGTSRAAVDPITGDVELTYRYPAYMKRDPRTLSGTGGEIRAPKGTEVTLSTRADRPVKAAEIAVEYAAVPLTPTLSPRQERGEREESSRSAPRAQREESSPSAPRAQREESSPSASRAQREESSPSAPRAQREESSRSAPRAQREESLPSPPRRGGEGQGEGAIYHHSLTVKNGRDLTGSFLVEEGGSYRFRFLDARGKAVAEGPPIPIAIEEDAFPEARITEPDHEIEVDPGAVIHVEWQADDDFGLQEVALVVKPPMADERRRVLRKPDGVRRDGGTLDLDLGPEGLAEGDRLSFWIEALDDDTVSGPKKGVSETRTVKIYSEAEHRRAVLDKARRALEEAVILLADRLELFAQGSIATPDRLVVAGQLDVRTRHLHEGMRVTAREIRRDKTGPREVAAALENVAGQIRVAEQRLAAARQPVAAALRIRTTPDRSLVGMMRIFDGQLDEQLEKGILYLEQLLDKQRGEDLVRLGKELGRGRRELADLLERFRASPTEQGKKELVARIARMKERVKDLLAKMAELSKGFADEHMNAEALAEMSRSRDLVGGLDEVERLLAKGDVEGAMKALDQMASAMDQMLAGLQRTAGMPDEKAQALMKEMLAFKDQIGQVKGEQERAAAETEKLRESYRADVAKRVKEAQGKIERLEKLAKEARRDVQASEPGVTMRAQPELDEARDSLGDLERALGTREMGAAWDMARRSGSATERLAQFLDEDVSLAERNPSFTRRDPQSVRDAARNAARAVPKVREIMGELSKLFPDPRSMLSKEDQQRLESLARRQAKLEQKAGDLQRQLSELMEKAPIFPPSAPGQLGETRGHMGQAAAQLMNKNPQRGRGEQELALDALERFQKGLEEAAKKGKGGGGMGFPFPFAESGGEENGDGFDPSREKVEIPGAEAHKVPEEFRKDLLEAMKQGAPERYRGEVQRYYEELVK